MTPSKTTHLHRDSSIGCHQGARHINNNSFNRTLRSSVWMTVTLLAVCASSLLQRVDAATVPVTGLTSSTADGDWNDPSIWDNGVPDSNLRVIVSEGTTVNLGGIDHVAGELIVHGTLNVPEGVADTALVRTHRVRARRSGVAISDSASGAGYLMHSKQNVQRRFGIARNTNSNVVAVRYSGLSWQFNNNSDWVDFTARKTDRLIATVDFDSGTVSSMSGQFGITQGIPRGYLFGNLSFEANKFGNRVSAGDVWVDGDMFVSATRRALEKRVIENLGDGVRLEGGKSGVGFLLHSIETLQSRLGMSDEVNSNVVAVRFVEGRWQHCGNGGWQSFKRTATDRLVAAVDFSNSRITSLCGSTGVVNDIQAGFVGGGLSFRSEPGSINVQVFGDTFVAGRHLRRAEFGWAVDKTLTARFIHVNGEGIFSIGSDQHRYDDGTFTLTLTGVESEANHTIPMANGKTFEIEHYDGFIVAEKGGRLQFFGEHRLSFTKLAATAPAGSSSIRVANVIERNFDGVTSAFSDGQMVFKVGDEIVIASSSRDYHEEDVRTVVAVTENDGTTELELDFPLSNFHYGEIESYGNAAAPGTRPREEPIEIDLRAEVALLSRNVVIKGLDSQDTDIEFGDRRLLETATEGNREVTTNGIGGHIIIFGSARQTGIDGVQFDLMGQAGRSGRYPVHWYHGGDKEGDFLINCSVTNSHNRGVVVHGTDNLLIQGVALHDIHGHGFFTQSGVEVGNRFYNNIALGIHRVGTSRDRDDPFIVDVHDWTVNQNRQFGSSSAFWITSADNIYVGNVAAGAEGSGYWFAPVAEAERAPSPEEFAKGPPELHEIYGRDPLALTIDLFEYNTVHSAETGLVFREIVQTGFRGPNDIADRLFSGDESVLGDVGEIKDLTIYKTDTGVYSRIDEAIFNYTNIRAADNQVSFWDTCPTNITNGLFVGHSLGNSQFLHRQNPVAFFRYFDQMDLRGLHFANFGVPQYGVIPQIFRNGGFQNQMGSTITGTSFEDEASAESVRFIEGGPVAVPSTRPLLDLDGSLTEHVGGGAGYSLLRKHDFWFDGLNGDRVIAPQGDANQASLTRKQFASFHLTTRGEGGGGPNVRLRITSPAGNAYEFGGVRGDEATNSVGRSPFVDDPRSITIIGDEYTIEPVRPYDLGTNTFRFAYFDWSSPENSVSNVFRLVDAANEMTPTYSQTGQELPSVNSLPRLRAATENTFFRDSNGDLYLKLFNATANTPGAIDRDIFKMVPF